MPLYDGFNFVEACLWGLVALVIPFRAQAASRRQRVAVAIGSVAFLVFSATDLLEIGRAGHLPGWLWGLKIACGTAILSARYTYRGWRTFQWRDREFLFALAVLFAVVVVIALQYRLEAPSRDRHPEQQTTHDPQADRSEGFSRPAHRRRFGSLAAPGNWRIT